MTPARQYGLVDLNVNRPSDTYFPVCESTGTSVASRLRRHDAVASVSEDHSRHVTRECARGCTEKTK